MKVIEHEDIGAAGSGSAHSEAKGAKTLNCTLEQSSPQRKAKDVIRIKRANHQKLDISFQRTIRVPDGIDGSELPPCMGTFPLYSVANYTDKLPESMAAKGGLFFPMYQREAMWISFKSGQPFAVQIFVGGVNAVSGDPAGDDETIMMRGLSLMEEKKTIQDYVVTPKQLWLDGIATDTERVRQFVAMPLGSGYSVEAQVTGQDLVGGLQFHITPSTPPARDLLTCEFSKLTKSEIAALKGTIPTGLDDSPIQTMVETLTGKKYDFSVLSSDWITELKLQILSKRGIPFYSATPYDSRLHLVLKLRGGGSGPDPKDVAMGVAPGGLIKQCILRDNNPASIWERDSTICFNVHILNSDMFQQVTGKAPPSTPVSAKTYADEGLPYYEIYGETSTIEGDFNSIKSLKGLDKIKNENGKCENEGEDGLESNKKAKDSSDEEDEDDSDDDERDNHPVDDDRDEQPLQNPIILLNPTGSAMGMFTPVSELMEELSRMKLRNFQLIPAKE